MKYLSQFNKMNPIAGLVLVVVLTISSAQWGCSRKQQDETQQKRSQGRTLEYEREVTFLDGSGEPVTSIWVALADEPSERNTGLMDVRRLPPDRGMLFIFEQDEPRSFWMANTPLSLDIIFVNSRMEIVRIHHSTRPYAEKNFVSGAPARYVVETNGGFCISHDIQEGMSMEISNPKHE